MKLYNPQGEAFDADMTDEDFLELMKDGVVGEGVRVGVGSRYIIHEGLIGDSPIWTDKAFVKAMKSYDEAKNFGQIKGETNYPKDYRYYLSSDGNKVIEPLTKNLNYHTARTLLKMRDKYGLEELDSFMHQYLLASSEMEVMMTLVQMYNIEETCQMQTDKMTSDQALFTEVNGFEEDKDIPWFPEQVLEFFFDCPDLPTLIAYRGDILELPKFFGLNKIRFQLRNQTKTLQNYEKDSIFFFGQTASGTLAQFVIDSTTIKPLIEKDCSSINIVSDHFRSNTSPLEGLDFDSMSCVIRLCLKSMIHAHSDPICVDRNPSKESLRNGKPNVKGRPSGKNIRLVYVPRMVSYKPKDEPKSGSREFKGRCEVKMHFRHDRYAKSGLQGTFKTIPAVLGANGENPHDRKNTIYRNRKIKTGFKIIS